MRKFLFVAGMAAFVGMSFGSCKKDYTCTCTISGQTTSTQIMDAKKKDAQDACESLDTQVKAQDAANSCKLD